MCSGRSRNSISKLISASFGRYGFRLICSLMRQSFEKRLFVCDLWAPRSNAHSLFISFINYFFSNFKIWKSFSFFLWLFRKSENFNLNDAWEPHRMRYMDLNFWSIEFSYFSTDFQLITRWKITIPDSEFLWTFIQFRMIITLFGFVVK